MENLCQALCHFFSNQTLTMLHLGKVRLTDAQALRKLNLTQLLFEARYEEQAPD